MQAASEVASERERARTPLHKRNIFVEFVEFALVSGIRPPHLGYFILDFR